MNHWPFIIASYAAFALFLLQDVVLPMLHRKKLLRTLAQRERREKTRSTQ